MFSKHYKDELRLQIGIAATPHPPPSPALSVYLLVVSGTYLIKQKGSLTCHLKLPQQMMKDY